MIHANALMLTRCHHLREKKFHFGFWFDRNSYTSFGLGSDTRARDDDVAAAVVVDVAVDADVNDVVDVDGVDDEADCTRSRGTSPKY